MCIASSHLPTVRVPNISPAGGEHNICSVKHMYSVWCCVQRGECCSEVRLITVIIMCGVLTVEYTSLCTSCAVPTVSVVFGDSGLMSPGESMLE